MVGGARIVPGVVRRVGSDCGARMASPLQALRPEGSNRKSEKSHRPQLNLRTGKGA